MKRVSHFMPGAYNSGFLYFFKLKKTVTVSAKSVLRNSPDSFKQEYAPCLWLHMKFPKFKTLFIDISNEEKHGVLSLFKLESCKPKAFRELALMPPRPEKLNIF